MKKLLLTILAVAAISFTANAQLYVGGNVGFGVTASDGGSATAWELSPEVGYNFNDSIAAGVALTFAGSPFSFSVDPYFRWYFAKAGNAKFLADAILSAGKVSDAFIWGLGVSPGIAFNINNRWSVVSHLAFIGYEGAKSGGAFTFSLLNNTRIGFFYNF